MSFASSYGALLEATQAQMRLPFPDTVKQGEEEKQNEADGRASPLPAVAPFSSFSASSFHPHLVAPPAFSAPPSLPLPIPAAVASSPCSCSSLLPHLSSLHGGFSAYQLHLNSSLLSLSSAVERAEAERVAFERRWKSDEVDFRRRVGRQLEDVREDVQQQMEGLRFAVQSQPPQRAASSAAAQPPPPPSNAISALQGEVASLHSALSSVLSSLQSEREERLRLSRRVDSLQAELQSAAAEQRRERAREGREAEQKVTAQVERLTREVAELREQRRREADMTAEALHQPPAVASRDAVSAAADEAHLHSHDAAHPPPQQPKERDERQMEDNPPSSVPSSASAAAPSISAATAAPSSPSASIPYNLFIRLWNLPPHRAQQSNNPIAALFVPSPSPSATDSAVTAEFAYVSQTEWLRSSSSPVFQQALLWDWEDGQQFVKVSVYDVEEENVRDEDRVGSALIPTAALRAAARPSPSSAQDGPPNALTFHLSHEEPAKQALLHSTLLMVECEVDTSTDATTPRSMQPATVDSTSSSPALPLLSLVVSCTRLPQSVRPSNPICALFVQGEGEEWLYTEQTEWLKATSSPSFAQPLSVEDPEDGQQRAVRLSVYDVDSEEVRDEDRVGSCTLTLQQLRQQANTQEPLKLPLLHEEPAKMERLKAVHSTVTLLVSRVRDDVDGVEAGRDDAVVGDAKDEDELQREGQEEGGREEVEEVEEEEDGFDVTVSSSASEEGEVEEQRQQPLDETDSSHQPHQLPLRPRLADDIELDLSDSSDDSDGGVEEG